MIAPTTANSLCSGTIFARGSSLPRNVRGSLAAVTGMSGNQFVHNFTVHVGEAKIPAGVAVGQPGVIKTEQMQDRGVQVVDVDLPLDRPKAEFVRGAMHVPALDAAAGQPHGETVMVVVAAFARQVVGEAHRQFHGRRAAELPSPNHQGVVKHAALFEVLQ